MVLIVTQLIVMITGKLKTQQVVFFIRILLKV